MPTNTSFSELTPIDRPAPKTTEVRRQLARFAGVAGASILAIGLALTISTSGTSAQSSPPADPYTGLWFDDTGKGAVEIGHCGGNLCGKIAWLRSPTDERGRPLRDDNNPDPRRRNQPICGLPVMGGLKPQHGGIWDEGWIYDPKVGKSYDVELKLRAIDVLQVTGYLGVKLLSESFIWKRAPETLARCTLAQQPGAPARR